jgi:hypothetical protein
MVKTTNTKQRDIRNLLSSTVDNEIGITIEKIGIFT